MMNINKAINYIYANLDKNLSVEEIAAQGYFSKYHFNRVFKGSVGENIYSFIKRMKLERAAFMLKTAPHKSITDIAVEAGYSSSNFASAFRQYFGVSASAFRREQQMPLKDSFSIVIQHIQNLKKNEHIFKELDKKIKLKRIAELNLSYKRVICNYTRDLETAWCSFCTELEEKQLLKENTCFIGISYDDPLLTVDEDRCIYDMCVALEETAGYDEHNIKEGLYACYAFQDEAAKLILTFNEIFSLWLPFCRYELEDKPTLEIYRSGIDEDGKISLEICIPIKNG